MNLVRIENGDENSMSLADFMKAAELTELRFSKSNDPRKTTQWLSTPFGRVFLYENTDISNINSLVVVEDNWSTDPESRGRLWILNANMLIDKVVNEVVESTVQRQAPQIERQQDIRVQTNAKHRQKIIENNSKRTEAVKVNFQFGAIIILFIIGLVIFGAVYEFLASLVYSVISIGVICFMILGVLLLIIYLFQTIINKN